jgi:hypothetical protein
MFRLGSCSLLALRAIVDASTQEQKRFTETPLLVQLLLDGFPIRLGAECAPQAIGAF